MRIDKIVLATGWGENRVCGKMRRRNRSAKASARRAIKSVIRATINKIERIDARYENNYISACYENNYISFWISHLQNTVENKGDILSRPPCYSWMDKV